MVFRYDTYCGLFCGACPVLVANEQDRVAEIAEQWEENERDLVCHGCKTAVTCIYCRSCDIRECARDHDVEFCSDCVEYPCDRLKSFEADPHPHHSIVIRNLIRIREVGSDAWLSEQDSRWRCTECGQRFTWYDENCGACGANVRSCRKD